MDLSGLFNILWILFLIQAFVPLLQRYLLGLQRVNQIRSFERARGSRVITLIHRQETMSFLGIPIARYIDIEDSEKVLRAIHLTESAVPIDIVLHTPGGRVLAVTALGATFAQARERCYKAAQTIQFEGRHYRTDIARDTSEHA